VALIICTADNVPGNVGNNDSEQSIYYMALTMMPVMPRVSLSGDDKKITWTSMMTKQHLK
jgi:hypothetical protein